MILLRVKTGTITGHRILLLMVHVFASCLVTGSWDIPWGRTPPPPPPPPHSRVI